jgi:queuine tRNA-ribosyltransferase
MKFEITKSCSQTKARLGTLITARGLISTPAFFPLATQGSVKTLTPDELKALGAKAILGNTYHLYLRPGISVIKKHGGLCNFMSWDGPLITDSGGFQVFSLGHLCRVTEEGVLFRSHIDGSEHLLTPELAIKIQEELGGDIIMTFDECSPYDIGLEGTRQAMLRTHRWAERCLQKHRREGQALFGIVQGGIFHSLRRESVEFLTSLNFPGYAIGGLSVGEPKENMYAIACEIANLLPQSKPRHLMGVGSPEDLVECVSYGIDMFDCALPTRIARNGAFLTAEGRLNIKNARFKDLDAPLDPTCDCYTCRTFSASYLHHLFKCEELLSYRLATIHNLHFIMKLMEDIRASILNDTFPNFRKGFLSRYKPANQP